MIPLPQDRGFHVTAVQIPLTSLADDADVTRRALAAQEGPTLLVGHSYGGKVGTRLPVPVSGVAKLANQRVERSGG